MQFRDTARALNSYEYLILRYLTLAFPLAGICAGTAPLRSREGLGYRVLWRADCPCALMGLARHIRPGKL